MEWLKSSNVIVVTKSVTAIEAVVTRYLLTSKSEGITIDGNVWSEVRQNPTSENRYVWAYDTYHYTDRTTRNTSPYIFDEYQSPKFEVDFSSDSYEIHPRWNNTSYITFKVKKLNGLTGNITITQNSSSRGIGLPIYDTSSDSYSISIENKSTTSTSFSFTISISNCVETFEIKGMMVDADSKYIGTVSTLPDPNVCVEGDRCFYKPTDNEGSLYIYDSESSSWKSIDESGLSVTEKNLIYTEAMKDIIDNIPANSSILSQYGFFNTIISSIIKAETSFVDDMYAKNLDVKNGNFKFEITSGKIKVSYNGNTVFQIDPSTGNVFLGKPNETLDAPLSGFMYDCQSRELITKDKKVVINESGAMEAAFKNVVSYMTISGTYNINTSTHQLQPVLLPPIPFGAYVESVGISFYDPKIRGLISDDETFIVKCTALGSSGNTPSSLEYVSSETSIKEVRDTEIPPQVKIGRKLSDIINDHRVWATCVFSGPVGTNAEVSFFVKLRIDTDLM